MTAPTTAVVVPVRGHAALLDGCLAALAAQDAPIGEVVVVDDSPAGDGGGDAGAGLGDLPGVTVLRSGGRGPYAARNVGWRHAGADVVLFCDARSRPRPGWAAALTALFADDDVVLAGSEVLVSPGAGGGTRAGEVGVAARAAALMQPFALANHAVDPFFLPYLPTCALAVRRAALVTAGGFPEVRSGGDADLCWQVLRDTGGRLATVPEVLVDWVPRTGVVDHLEQFYRYGRSTHQLRLRWAHAGAPVPTPRPGPRIAARAGLAAARAGAATVSGDRERAARALVGASWALNEVGYALEHRGARRARDARTGRAR